MLIAFALSTNLEIADELKELAPKQLEERMTQAEALHQNLADLTQFFEADDPYLLIPENLVGIFATHAGKPISSIVYSDGAGTVQTETNPAVFISVLLQFCIREPGCTIRLRIEIHFW